MLVAEQGGQVGNGGEGRTVPVRVRVLELGGTQDGNADRGRAGQLVIGAVADVDAFCWVGAEPVGGGTVDRRVGLGQPDCSGEDHDVESFGEWALWPRLAEAPGEDAD